MEIPENVDFATELLQGQSIAGDMNSLVRIWSQRSGNRETAKIGLHVCIATNHSRKRTLVVGMRLARYVYPNITYSSGASIQPAAR